MRLNQRSDGGEWAGMVNVKKSFHSFSFRTGIKNGVLIAKGH
jgi:hypothetical protein